MVILVLGPALEGMVVAFIAIETRGQKEVGGILHRFGRSADNLPIAGSRILPIRSRSGQNLASKLVIRRVLFDLVTNPRAEQFGALAAEKFAVALKHVRPFIGPKIDVLRATNEAVHHGIAFDPYLAAVVEEGAD